MAEWPETVGFRWATDGQRVPPWQWEPTPEEAERLKTLAARGPWISLHDHPIRLPEPMHPDVWRRYVDLGRERIGWDGLRRGGLTAVFYSMLGSDDPGAVLRWAAFARAAAGQAAGFRVAERAEDLRAAWSQGEVAVYLALESASPVGDCLEHVDLLWGAGIRSMGLTYNTENAIGCGLLCPEDRGLTAFGRRVVARMQELGMLVDLAHVGDRTSLDAIEASTRPVVVSHAGARSLWPSPRMKPDEVIDGCAATGGVIGIEAAPHTTLTLQHRTHDIDAVMAHVEYCIERVGADHVALGPDTFFGDHRGLHALYPTELPAPEHPIVPYVAGFENPGENHRNAAAWMVRHGYPDDVIRKVLGLNVLRVVESAVTPRLSS